MNASVCVSIDTILNMPLKGLRHKTQCRKANLRVWRFWMPNTFPRSYLNFEPISLVVKSMVIPQENAMYMVPRPLQKLGGNSPLCPHGLTDICSSNAYSADMA